MRRIFNEHGKLLNLKNCKRVPIYSHMLTPIPKKDFQIFEEETKTWFVGCPAKRGCFEMFLKAIEGERKDSPMIIDRSQNLNDVRDYLWGWLDDAGFLFDDDILCSKCSKDIAKNVFIICLLIKHSF